MSEKKPRLFYWEDAEDMWSPCNGFDVEDIVSVMNLNDKETQTVTFQRVDMTDEEFESLPEQ